MGTSKNLGAALGLRPTRTRAAGAMRFMRGGGIVSGSSDQAELQPAAEDAVAPPQPRQVLRDLFHRVNNVIPEEQVVRTIPPEMPAADALSIMDETGFSQLPVLRGDEVLGVFSYRSFARHTVRMQTREPLGDIPVEEFVESMVTVHASDELVSCFDYLDRDNAVLVGSPTDLQAIVAPLDVLRYLYDLAEPFVQLGEIERSLKLIINHALDEKQLEECALRALAHEYEGREGDMPVTTQDMTLQQLVAIVRHGENYELLRPILITPRDMVAARFRPLPDLRNDVFHFRRDLTDEERATIAEVRNWLLRKLRGTEVAP